MDPQIVPFMGKCLLYTGALTLFFNTISLKINI